ncbi:MAG: MnmC family methyltransferase [Planctomycetota bacterium]|jgi:tRNA U34 5-methylaminomethyl-2-thiouridine-forming methyltransferase MnmC|nr:MnmC family methyltransferase [Planctomycetota bacterium]MDP6762984.1 MnmC family methyltransferase [Planctomycetota bacterium]MDP6987850.1 MnmC family methyltransferase [Planctomycetota bacterium]
MPAETWSVRRTADGTPTLCHPGHGETCHSRVGAWTEARERYVLGCRVADGLARDDPRPFAVLDVGTGPGMNLAALAACAAEAPGSPRLAVTSLESDPTVLEAGRRLVADASLWGDGELAREAAAWLAVVTGALDSARAAGGAPVEFGEAGRLSLLVGDGRETLPPREETYDAVFLDPFSPAVDGSLWEPEFLRVLARRLRPGGWLATYSAASRVRARLAACGLRVGATAALGSKAEGTLASPDREPPPLAPRQRRRLGRRVPALCAELGWPIPPLFGAGSGGFPFGLELESGRKNA